MGPQPEADTANVTLCYYRAMRDPSNDPKDPHDLSMNYWYTFAARLLFVVAFEVSSPKLRLGEPLIPFLFLHNTARGDCADRNTGLHNSRHSVVCERKVSS